MYKRLQYSSRNMYYARNTQHSHASSHLLALFLAVPRIVVCYKYEFSCYAAHQILTCHTSLHASLCNIQELSNSLCQMKENTYPTTCKTRQDTRPIESGPKPTMLVMLHEQSRALCTTMKERIKRTEKKERRKQTKFTTTSTT